MPGILDALYHEFCRARLAEMRRQLLLWPGTSMVAEEGRQTGQRDDASERAIGSASPQGWGGHAERNS